MCGIGVSHICVWTNNSLLITFLICLMFHAVDTSKCCSTPEIQPSNPIFLTWNSYTTPCILQHPFFFTCQANTDIRSLLPITQSTLSPLPNQVSRLREQRSDGPIRQPQISPPGNNPLNQPHHRPGSDPWATPKFVVQGSLDRRAFCSRSWLRFGGKIVPCLGSSSPHPCSSIRKLVGCLLLFSAIDEYREKSSVINTQSS